MMKMFECPFCGEKLSQKEMQFHVGIPICIELRKLKAPTEVLPGATESFNIPVPKLDLDYFGAKNLRKLICYTIDRMTYGHPDEGKIIPLEKYRKQK